MTKPFNVESSDIKSLNDIQLTQLLKILLHAEAHAFGIPQNSVEVALNIITGDGGEDGRISWKNSKESTDFIPSRNTLFQNKATNMGPSEYGKELVTKQGDIKEQVDNVLSAGGSYIVFTTQELNGSQKLKRITAMRTVFQNKNKDYASSCILKIYDASQISSWVNCYTTAIVSVLHWLGKPLERGLKSYNLWKEDPALELLPFSHVKSRENFIDSLRDKLLKPQSCCRVVGLSGLGKTRLAFEIFRANDTIKSLLVYVDANHIPKIDALVADWISLGYRSILVVDNCDYQLHNSLVQEVSRNTSKISLLSLDYDFQEVLRQTFMIKLNPMTDDEITDLLKPKYASNLPDLDRITSFAQGFPQIAVLLAQSRLDQDPRTGELTEDDLANKLLWSRNQPENTDFLKILQVSSLFDSFGVEAEAEDQLTYIAQVSGFDSDKVYECIQIFAERGIIDRRGRLAQVVPKPLAIRLAGQWWRSTRQQKQKDLISEMPPSMVESFCRQVEKMNFHSDVKSLTQELCGYQSPFGQAEVILSKQGSRLFRSFIVVNPESTSATLSRILEEMNLDQLLQIDPDVRRNLVWGLERLCFHAEFFTPSAWCLLKLAAAENEVWTNNATGIFIQLFRVFLSGTEATPDTRIQLLKQALNLNQKEVDLVIIKALHNAISTEGSTRTCGSEYQGIGAPLQEWKPQIWQDVFDYWQTCFDLLISMFHRENDLKLEILDCIGDSIRGLVKIGRIDTLDSVIKQVVELNGYYWPSARNNIKSTLRYDADSLPEESIQALYKWLDILSLKDVELEDKLRAIVSNPYWESIQDDQNNYINVAANNAQQLASELTSNLESLLPLLHLLLHGQQNQAYTFGRQIILELENESIGLFTMTALQSFTQIENANSSLILGIYRGLYEKSTDIWQEYLNILIETEDLVALYPQCLCQGSINKNNLDQLIDLIHNNSLPLESLNILGYGSVVKNINAEVFQEFCLQLFEINTQASWLILKLMFAYCYQDDLALKSMYESVKMIVTSVPLHDQQIRNLLDFHEWDYLTKELLKTSDQELVDRIADQLIDACKYGMNYSYLWDYFKPLLLMLMRDYGSILWPKFNLEIAKREGSQAYWLQDLFKREMGLATQMPSILSALPVEDVISWCHQHPDLAPYFTANCIDVYENKDGSVEASDLCVALLKDFGKDDKVLAALSSNMISRGWVGSLVPYLETDKKFLTPLLNHDISNVRRWAKDQISYIEDQIKRESNLDEEQSLR
ncbi:hypothetical protein [Prochlorothrix hollandica]|uniref:Uncharacterized protein n=1 Tax=Prochlorothrix hollandica PCC 9006 = CALU 1027 TaxID=317619 RepID=A0A0M2PYF0_PROHO|nr:hypothetical protein [Prochlorothrix hollandica]KKJ01461.1 hypothetical protein PROH_03835 [Prochlorothrix hollandica PCC 9006 = CALU 1027]